MISQLEKIRMEFCELGKTNKYIRENISMDDVIKGYYSGNTHEQRRSVARDRYLGFDKYEVPESITPKIDRSYMSTEPPRMCDFTVKYGNYNKPELKQKDIDYVFELCNGTMGWNN